MDPVGELTPVPMQEVWPDEAKTFTPWLAQNPEMLGKALGLNLEHEATEHGVGRYSADLVFRETSEQRRVVVENMFGMTDHDHLGKLITYAAGLGTHYVVLLANDFRAEHRSALNWLNSISTDEFRFFGVTVELWRIGDSQPAPQLRVAVQPDDWQQSVRGKLGDLRDSEKAYLRFWEQFLSEFQNAHPGWRRSSSPRKDSAIGFPAPRPGWYRGGFCQRADGRYGFRAELTIRTSEVATTNAVYDALYEQKREEIEDELGAELEWERLDEAKTARISLYFPDELRIGDEKRWPEARAWLIEALGRLQKVFDPALKDLRTRS